MILYFTMLCNTRLSYVIMLCNTILHFHNCLESLFWFHHALLCCFIYYFTKPDWVSDWLTDQPKCRDPLDLRIYLSSTFYWLLRNEALSSTLNISVNYYFTKYFLMLNIYVFDRNFLYQNLTRTLLVQWISFSPDNVGIY